MTISLIICTFKRPKIIQNLLESIQKCTKKPDTILVVDSSPDDNTKDYILNTKYNDIKIEYYKVPPEHRGLTRQRNYGISKLTSNTKIVAFLDDDITIEPDYFEKLLETYDKHPDAIGVGGIDLQNNHYQKKEEGLRYPEFKYYELDGWVVREPLRYKVRKLFGLMTNLQPGLIPEYSHGRSTLPPNGKIYEVEHFMGGIASFRREIFDIINFSTFFDGYGLYEDFDFCVRALQYGKLYVNTNARVWHFHDPAGRPDLFKYGKMVVRNGWYVWRLRFPNPPIKARFKWHATTLLLANIRLFNAITSPKRKDALMDFLGRILAWLEVLFNPPVISE